MKLIELERIEFDRLVKKFEDEVLISMGSKRLNKPMVNEIFGLLRVMVTQNHFIQQRGFVTYLGNKYSDSGQLCNGKQVNSCRLADMPILLSEEFYSILLSNNMTRLDRLMEVGILHRHEIPPEFSNPKKSKKRSAKYYYQIGEIAQGIIPDDPVLTKIDAKHADLCRKYFQSKNNTASNEYKRLIRMLPEFYFYMPNKDEFINLYLPLYEDNEYEKPPEELLEIIHRQMTHFNNTDLDGFTIKCTSDLDHWAGRFYATPTYITKLARGYLRCRSTNSHLREFDIRNSQFHFLNKVLKGYFGDKCTGKFDYDLRHSDIYKEIAKVIFDTNHPTSEQRDIVKGGMFYSFFRGSFEPSKRTLEHQAKVMDAVKNLYPDLVSAVEKLKGRKIPRFSKADPHYFKCLQSGTAQYKKRHENNQYRKVSFCAASTETQIMKKIWYALWKKDIRYLTVHDAILIDSSDLEIIAQTRSIIEEILKAELGYLPTVREENLIPHEEILEEMEKAA
jgi:hypothetical protein